MMTGELIDYCVVIALIAVTFYEMRTGRIPNYVPIGLVILFAAKVLLAPEAVMIWPQLALAVGVFVAGLGFFATAGIGAGAVKLATALALFVPLANWGYRGVAFLFIALLTGFVFIIAARIFGSEDNKWYVLRKSALPLSVPMLLTAGTILLF